MVAHAITANDEHESWPITLGYEGVTGIPGGAAWPNGTTVWMISQQQDSGNAAKVKQCASVDLATHEVRRDFAIGDYTNADVGTHDVQWEARYPDGTTQTWPKPNTFDTLVVGRNLGDAPAL